MNMGIGRDPVPGLTHLTPDIASLKVNNGSNPQQTYGLNKARLTLGRHQAPMGMVDIDLSNCEMGGTPTVSRRHAEIQWVDGALQMIDLGSHNGTWVDGQKLTPLGDRQPSAPVVLKVGSKIQLGCLELEVIRNG